MGGYLCAPPLTRRRRGELLVCECVYESEQRGRVGHRERERERESQTRPWTMSCASSSPVGFVASHFAAVAQNSSPPVVVASPMKSGDGAPSPAPRSSSSYMLVI